MRGYWSHQTYPFLKSVVPHMRRDRHRRTAERYLADLHSAYAHLLDEHVTMWSNFVMHSAPMLYPVVEDAVAEREEMPLLLEGAIHEILGHCREALADLETEAPDSLEGHKAIGKVLAYGRVTSILHRLQLRIATQEESDVDADPCGTLSTKKRLTN
jgi:hypothetical protein